jgi:hypothetical protein
VELQQVSSIVALEAHIHQDFTILDNNNSRFGGYKLGYGRMPPRYGETIDWRHKGREFEASQP